ncbi:MAG: TIGR03016 family PEP-CTERM system-associated outer membrane protein [Burkholderiaceae bacterium]|nr:TIGR03016 family PEP-CTERM system-associated outer membrane protein [Burkholderiaceae bacterium]
MAINTTGNLRRKPAHSSLFRLSFPMLMSALAAASVCHAELQFTPTVTLNETYTDNVSLASDALAKSELITEVTPGFTMQDNSARLKLSANYQYNYFDYSDKEVANTNKSTSTLMANMKASLVPELFFLDSTASISQQALSAFGPQVADNSYSSVNRAELRSYVLSPYMVDRLGSEAVAQLRYTYSSMNTGASVLGNSHADGVTLDLASGTAFQRLTWDLMVNHQTIQNPVESGISSETASAKADFFLVPTFALTGNVGFDKYDYQALPGEDSKGNFWLVGFDWTPSSRTNLQASAGRRYFGSTYNLALRLHSRHTVWSASYNDTVTNTTSQAATPSGINSASLLTQLDSSTITDPGVLQQTVASFLNQTGTPAMLANNLNFYSYSFFRQRSWQAAAAFNGARSTLLLSLVDTEQTSLSAQQADSLLLGVNGLFLNQNDRQLSGMATWNYKLTTLSNAFLNYTQSRVTALSTDLTTTSKLLLIGVNTQLRHNVRGMIEIRRNEGDAGEGTLAHYRENAILATVNILL